MSIGDISRLALARFTRDLWRELWCFWGARDSRRELWLISRGRDKTREIRPKITISQLLFWNFATMSSCQRPRQTVAWFRIYPISFFFFVWAPWLRGRVVAHMDAAAELAAADAAVAHNNEMTRHGQIRGRCSWPRTYTVV